jgi:hypothetical protein
MLYTLDVAITVNDIEDLPANVEQDDVAQEAHAVIYAALQRWYQERGHTLLACEPGW